MKVELPEVKKELNDYHGESHVYWIKPFAYDESFNLGLELADLIGGPIGEALKSLFMGGDIDLDSINEGTIGRALAEAVTLPRRILDAGGSGLVKRMFTETVRMARDEQGELYKQNLVQPDARTLAYAGGNQRESVEALWAVLEVNYGPFLTALLQAVSPYLSGLGGSLIERVQLSPAPADQTEKTADGEPTKTPRKPVEIE